MSSLLDLDFRKQIASYISNERDRIDYNHDIARILGGNLKPLLEQKMMEDLGVKPFAAARTRESPINVFGKIIDKQTKIYSQTVIRTVEGGTDSDLALLRWYEDVLNLNSRFNKNNENYNAFLYSLLQIGLKEPNRPENEASNHKVPFIRTIPNHQFLIMNTSQTDPTEPDVVIVFMGQTKRADGSTQHIYYVTSKDEFIIMDQRGDLIEEMMLERELDGSNPYGVLNFVYANHSQDHVMPDIQADNKELSLLIPLLLTDLNYAVKFQAFSVFVAIDIEEKNVQLSPNSIISFQTKAGGEKPSFDVVKPTIDIGETLSLASSQMALWLSTKGIRPGQIAQIGADQLASGISKMIDESDTYDSIKKQIIVYENFEKDFWDKLLNYIHPEWVLANAIDNKTIFSAGAKVVTRFTQPVPMQSRGQLVTDLKSEVEAGFLTVKDAIKKLNPQMMDDQIDLMIAEIEAENPVEIPFVEPQIEAV